MRAYVEVSLANLGFVVFYYLVAFGPPYGGFLVPPLGLWGPSSPSFPLPLAFDPLPAERLVFTIAVNLPLYDISNFSWPARADLKKAY